MAKADILSKVGSWAFIIGVIIALVIGIVDKGQGSALMTGILIILGIIVGFLNVTGRETTPFLLAAVSLVLVSSFGGASLASVDKIGVYLNGTLSGLLTFVVPTTIIVALKAIWALARDE